MQRLVFLLLVLVSAAPRAQTTGADPRDVAVYRAVLAAKVRPEVDRFSAGAGIPTPAPVLTFDRTVALCRTPSDHPKRLGCIQDEHVVQAFERQLPQMQRMLFAGAISDGTRAEIARAFRQRNANSQPFPAASLEGVIVTTPEDLEVVMSRESLRTRGTSSFSLPAYSSDGYALLYASYVCGGLCGEGWLFLLRVENGSWKVVSIQGLWVS